MPLFFYLFTCVLFAYFIWFRLCGFGLISVLIAASYIFFSLSVPHKNPLALRVTLRTKYKRFIWLTATVWLQCGCDAVTGKCTKLYEKYQSKQARNSALTVQWSASAETKKCVNRSGNAREVKWSALTLQWSASAETKNCVKRSGNAR